MATMELSDASRPRGTDGAARANPGGSLRRWSEELEGDVVRIPE
jgi:hypothetical protein